MILRSINYISVYINRVKIEFICETCNKEITTNSNLTTNKKTITTIKKKLNNEESE